MIRIKPPISYGKITSRILKGHIKGKNVALICSNSVWQKSYISSVVEELEKDYEVSSFTHLRPNAPFKDIQVVIDHYKGNSPSTIIGIGGGSVLDACKALSVSFGKQNISDLFYKKAPMPDNSIHMLAIPTTAGTGAELSFGAIIYDDVNNVKGGIRGQVIQPNAVFIDVSLYKTASSKLIAEVGFDCLTHAVETYISLKSNPLTRYQSIAAIKTIIKCLPTAVKGSTNSLRSMAIASSLMGINLAYSSTCLPHRIQYIIGPMTDTSHAQGLIALYKGWLHLIGEDKKKSGLTELENDLSLNNDFIDIVTNLKEELCINYTLSTLGVDPHSLDIISSKVSGSVENDPCYKNINTIEYILENSF